MQQKKNNKQIHTKKGLTHKKVFFILFVCTFILYGRSLTNQYALDDELVIENNKKIEKGFKGLKDIFTTFYADTGKMQYGYRPVVQSTFAIEYGIFGKNPFVSHLINLLLYVLLIFVLFIVLKKIFSFYNPHYALMVTLLFMAHPIHTEVVCSLKNRDELLSFLGGISAVYYMLRFTDNNKYAYFIAANVCLWLGFFSKLSALTFLGIIPLTLFFYKQTDIKKNLLASGLTMVFLLLLFYFSRLMLPQAVQPFSITENPLFIESSLVSRFSTGMLSLLFYLKKLVFPHPLLFFYGYNTMPAADMGNIWVWISFIVHTAVLFWALIKLKSRHVLAYAALFYFISISMFTNLATPVAGIVGERFAFAASLGFCIALVYFIFLISKTTPEKLNLGVSELRKLYYMLAVILLLYAFKTIDRNAAWKNRKTLYESDITYLSQSAKANSLLGNTLFKEALEDLSAKGSSTLDNRALAQSAIHYFNQSVHIYPAYATSWSDMGSAYFMFFKDSLENAAFCFHKAIESDTSYVAPYFNLAYTYELMGDLNTATYYYELTLNKDSTYLKALSNLSLLKNRLNDSISFFELNKKILNQYPDSEIPFINISNHYLLLGDTLKAIEYMEKAFEKSPQNKSLLNNLVAYYESKGHFEKANFYAEKLRMLK